jgi:Glycosyltransferase
VNGGYRRGGIAMVLPAREGFAPDRAGAIAMVVRRLALAADAVVIGAALTPVFPGIAYAPVRARGTLGYALGVIACVRRSRPSVIEVHQQPRLALILARLMPDARVMLVLHNDPKTMRGLRSPRQRRRTLARLHRVICVSAFLRDRYAASLAATTRLAILPNPLTLAELPETTLPRRPEILFAGRIVEPKGVADFIAACAVALPTLPGWSARIIGGDRFGPASPETAYVSAMRHAAAAAGVRFDGYRPHADVLTAMAQAAIVVVPSRWAEPFGLTALEAMASGAALIASNIGGLPEVAGSAGLLTPPGDIPALVAAITSLARDEPRRTNLAAAGRTRALQFDTPRIAALLQELRDAETPV